MKRILYLWAVMIWATIIPAQAQHLQFMGIPLTGTITQFQQKLAAKGVTHDKRLSALSDKGTRVFKGSFAGSDATIVVMYSVNTKIVYAAKAYYDCYSTAARDQKYDELKSLLEQKYVAESNNISEISEDDVHERFKITVTDDSGKIVLGYIRLHCLQDPIFSSRSSVHVVYQDLTNYNKNQNNKMKDL